MKLLALSAATALALSELVLGTGINCSGSAACQTSRIELQRIANIINGDGGVYPGISDDRYYNNGEHIWCGQSPDSWTCVFLQNSGGAPGHSIKELINILAEHGCVKCGSVPLFYPQGDNNVADGELTVNIVSNNNGCDGYC